MKFILILCALMNISRADVIAIPSGGGSGSSIATPVSIANGGTNKALTLSAGGVPWVDGDSFEILAAGDAGKVLTSGGAGAPTWETVAGGSQWTTDAGGIYYISDADSNVRIGASASVTANSVSLEVTSTGALTPIAFLKSSTGANGALGVNPLGDAAGTIYDFSVDFQGYTSANDNVAIMNFNRQGGVVNLGSGAATVRLAEQGAGTLTTDAAGLFVVTSDGRLKNIVKPFERGLDALKVVKPQVYKWKKESGYDQELEYSGFIAQNLAQGIPEAVTQGPDGYLAVQDRPVIAALVNAVNELSARLEALEGPKLKVRKAIPVGAIQKSKPRVPVSCVGSKKFCSRKGLK